MGPAAIKNFALPTAIKGLKISRHALAGASRLDADEKDRLEEEVMIQLAELVSGEHGGGPTGSRKGRSGSG
jgi:hypothetical protein